MEHYLHIAATLQRQLDTARELCNVAAVDGGRDADAGTVTKRASRDGNINEEDDEDEDDDGVSGESKGDRLEGRLKHAREAMMQSYLLRLTGGMFVGQGDDMSGSDCSSSGVLVNGSASTGSDLVSCMAIVACAQAAWWCELVRTGKLAAASVLMSRHLAFMVPNPATSASSLTGLSIDRVASSLSAVPDTTPIGTIIPTPSHTR